MKTPFSLLLFFLLRLYIRLYNKVLFFSDFHDKYQTFLECGNKRGQFERTNNTVLGIKNIRLDYTYIPLKTKHAM